MLSVSSVVKKRLFFLLLLVLLAVLGLVTLQSRASTGGLTAAYINVGQGDSILLRDGAGFDVLIDGGKPEAGPTVVAYLRAQGVDDIDVMVSTHPDEDHVGGLIDVLQMADIPVRAVVYNGYPGDTTIWYTFATAVATEGLIMTPAQEPQSFTWGDMFVQVLNPVPGLSSPEPNNASVVLLIYYGSEKFLFPGDIDSTQEAAILARGTPVAAQVLKVAHHGSNYSSGNEFLAAVAPTDAIISVGHNTYGHPGLEALTRLAAHSGHVWRTDHCGTITVFSNGTTHTVQCQYIYFVNLPLIERMSTPTFTSPPPVNSDLTITALSGLTNPEYVDIHNSGVSAQDMTGWTLVSVVGPQVYDFPAGTILAPGATVRIESFTAAVDDPPAILLWTNTAIWSNSGDKAELRDASNNLISSACYLTGCP